MSAPAPRVLVIMGVSGSGKTTVGQALGQRLGWAFQEGDDLHPAANIAKMAAGHPLDDADRAPWLAAVAAWIDGRLAAGLNGVVSCSALKRAYREVLTRGRPGVRVTYLRLAPAVVAARLARRAGHFMPPSLMASQFDDLEEPAPDEGVLVVDGDQPVKAQVDEIVRMTGLVPSAQ